MALQYIASLNTVKDVNYQKNHRRPDFYIAFELCSFQKRSRYGPHMQCVLYDQPVWFCKTFFIFYAATRELVQIRFRTMLQICVSNGPRCLD